MVKVAVAGFQHETNSYGFGQAGMTEFEIADSWPSMLKGTEVLSGTCGWNLPIAGFASAAKEVGTKLVPIIWAAAEPSGPVSDEAFEAITESIINGIRSSTPVDGIYLDLHGAMITESFEDGEGEILRRIRVEFGTKLPLVISLDLHANISKEMVERVDALTVYRTYPHLDMVETGSRAHAKLMNIISGTRFHRIHTQVPYLIPLHLQYTGIDPAKEIYGKILQVESANAYTEIAMGFTAGDTTFTGPTIVSHALSENEAENLNEMFLSEFLAAENQFEKALPNPDEAVTEAIQSISSRPVVLADIQDNPGAGASSDSTGILRSLVTNGAKNTLLGLMYDPDFVIKAHDIGENGVFSGALGGKYGHADDTPFEGQFQVEKLSNGKCRYTGEMYGGGVATLGPSVVVRVLDELSEVRIVVTSIRNQCLDLAHFTHFGLAPTQADIICLKSTVHFRADFEPIASKVIPVASPGLFPCLLEPNQYEKLRSGVRF